VRLLPTALLALQLATPVAAQDIRPADRDRLAAYDESLGRALAGTLAAGSPQEVDLLTAALAGVPGPLDPEGEWSCRTLKLGGLLPIAAYPSFRCRITALGPGEWRLEKLTGSQRLIGTIQEYPSEALYLGVGFVGDRPAVPYEDLPPDDQTPVEPGQTHAQVGLFQQAGPGQARLLLPQPLLESEFDLLWLTR
jgi:hypothetical protein